ncbi:asparagine synthase-related protein [Pseudobdellovibrio exovorus]|uniref:Uncharacterized protein n=1 Tax=Pseudobdellovibrio exovorus JSS TaxID=1184267 RepID=M4VBC4_9BACT|nr:asparagine synthase-related protein [Pseudobdellovibrio exovorus]AGH96697.1 hypothetical protein A11Q_2481 [Pseudobdellovibrio exovorus JSS]
MKLGYGQSFADYNPEEDFCCQLEPLTRVPDNAFAEARLCARELYQKYQRPLNLCLSGGLDSEAMALAFLAEDIPIHVWTLRFNNNLNEEDICHATAFCQHHQIEQKFVDLDVINFYEQRRFEDYLHRYKSMSVEVAVQLWFLDQTPEPVIWGGQGFRALRRPDDEIRLQPITQMEAVFFRYFQYTGKQGTPNFHFHSTPLIWSFFKTSLKLTHRLYPDDHVPEFYADKFQFYKMAGFPLKEISARSQKLHGFEKVKIYFDERLKKQQTDYQRYYRQWAESLYPYSKNARFVLPSIDPIRQQLVHF